ncbi:calcium-binding protein [Mesorhizobium sp. CN2-181]|uniref:calcium-binding protein n=1 Tax=Mesorhizobium yinganensis TaxID=3157707 RepID=UPI0032B80EC2
MTTKITFDGDLNNDGIADVTLSADTDGNGLGNHTLFQIDPTGDVAFDGLNLTEGSGQGFTNAPTAGAIVNFGKASIVNSLLAANVGEGRDQVAAGAGQDGADGGWAAGAIFNAGTLSLSFTTFQDNEGRGGDGGTGGAGSNGGDFGGDGGKGGTAGYASAHIINAAGASMALNVVDFKGGTAASGKAGNGGNGGDGILFGGDGGDGGANAFLGGEFLNFGSASGSFTTDLGPGLGNFGPSPGGLGGTGVLAVGDPGLPGSEVQRAFFGMTVGTDGNDLRIGLSGKDLIIGLDGADRLFGRNDNDDLSGDSGNDTLDGGAGNDALLGGAGDDTLIVSTGADTYLGGANTDELDFSAITKGVSIDLATTTAQTIFGGSVDLSLDIENVRGTDFGDTLTGSGVANRLDGGGGNDTLAGEAGDDIYIVDVVGDVVTEAFGDGVADRAMARSNYALAAGVDIELLTTVSSTAATAINLTGNALHQEITGNAGRNTLKDGGGAADQLRGLGGNDTYLVYAGGTSVIEGSTGGADKVLAAVDFTLAAGQYVEALATTNGSGTSAIDLTGNALHQTITGNAGVNILSDGGAGNADTMIGLSDNDTYRVYNGGDVIQETASQGAADRVMAAVDYRLGAGVHVELLSTNGSSGKSGIDLTGNEFAQEIVGNAGDNRLEGREGNDTMRGLGGNDTFVFNTKLGASNIDTIIDFNVADDRILLSDAIFTKLNTGVMLSGYFRANTTGVAQDANDHVIYETDTGKLFYDADGLGGAAGIQFAKIGIGLALTNLDFHVA